MPQLFFSKVASKVILKVTSKVILKVTSKVILKGAPSDHRSRPPSLLVVYSIDFIRFFHKLCLSCFSVK